MKLPEDQLHMIPYIQGAEPCVGLSKGHKLILIELIGFHRQSGKGKFHKQQNLWEDKAELHTFNQEVMPGHHQNIFKKMR